MNKQHEGTGAFDDEIAPGSFQLAVDDSGTTSYLRLAGEFDLSEVGRVENALDRVFRAPTLGRVVFDLRRLIFLDAAALGTILRANDRAHAEDFDLVVVRPRGLANRVFTLTRAGLELSMVDDAPLPTTRRPPASPPARGRMRPGT